MRRSLLIAVLLGLAVVVVSSPATLAQGGGTPTGGGQCLIGGKYVFVPHGGCPAGGGNPTTGGSQPVDNSAAEAAAAAAAAAELKRLQEEAARKEEIHRQQQIDEEAARQRQADFERKKQEALNGMKDLDGGGPGLKGGDDNLGLKDLSDSDSGGLGLKDAPNSNPTHNALDEANSIKVSTEHGLESETPEGRTTGTREDASKFGREVFDTAGDRHPSSINVGAALKNVGRPPAVRELLKHIPPQAQGNAAIKTSVDWYSHLDAQKTETKAKIAEVQKQIDTHAGDPTILSIEKTQLGNDLKRINTNEQTAESAIKKTLLNMNLPWIENPPTDTTKEKTK
jgi:hypothetical protein